MLVSWILRSMDTKITASIPFHDDAKRLWDSLDKRFCVANGPRLQQLRAAIVDCKQHRGMSVEDYFNKLMGLDDELTRLKPLHSCVSGNFAPVMSLANLPRIGRRKKFLSYWFR